QVLGSSGVNRKWFRGLTMVTRNARKSRSRSRRNAANPVPRISSRWGEGGMESEYEAEPQRNRRIRDERCHLSLCPTSELPLPLELFPEVLRICRGVQEDALPQSPMRSVEGALQWLKR